MLSCSNKPQNDETDDWDDDLYTEAEMTYPPEQYYRLSLAMEKVHFIDTLDGLQTCQIDLCKVRKYRLFLVDI